MTNAVLVIGNGEVGKAVYDVVSRKHETHIHDPAQDRSSPKGIIFDVVHICFPWSDEFDHYVEEYIERFKADCYIIHSTIDPDCKAVHRSKVAYSPVRGKHPHLAESMRIFVKAIAAENHDTLLLAKAHLMDCGIKVYEMGVRDAIFAKLLDTTYYGVNIAFAKYVNELCKREGLNFQNVYKAYNEQYNEGYAKFDEEQFIRPVLTPPPERGIGGHCVWENALILTNAKAGSAFTDLVLAMGKMPFEGTVETTAEARRRVSFLYNP